MEWGKVFHLCLNRGEVWPACILRNESSLPSALSLIICAAFCPVFWLVVLASTASTLGVSYFMLIIPNQLIDSSVRGLGIITGHCSCSWFTTTIIVCHRLCYISRVESPESSSVGPGHMSLTLTSFVLSLDYGYGMFKLLSFGGIGVWTLVDAVLACRILPLFHGAPRLNNKQHRR